jgi:hypothetical protein
MYLVERPVIHAVTPNTPAQDKALALRMLLLEGTCLPALQAFGIVLGVADSLHAATPELSVVALPYPLLAPFGQYHPMVEGTPYLVAAHLHDSGRIEAFGPFSCDEDAYDYFPDHSSPHDTQVVVFEVSTQLRPYLPR